MAAACCWKAESIAAMAMVWTVGVGLMARDRSSSKTLLWYMAASASKQILLMIDTASTGYLPEGKKKVRRRGLLWIQNSLSGKYYVKWCYVMQSTAFYTRALTCIQPGLTLVPTPALQVDPTRN